MGEGESAAPVGCVGDHPHMQLAPVASVSPAVQPIAPPAAADAPAAPAPAPAAAPHFAGIASPVAAASVEGAQDGVARLAKPVVEFPGIEAGQVFDVVKGSKAGFFGIKGEASVLRLDPDAASFKVKAGAFGIKVDVQVDIVQVDDTTVRISSKGSGIPDMSELGRVVESRPNYALFEQVSDPSKLTRIVHDGNGNIVIDTDVPTLGATHLILERRA